MKLFRVESAIAETNLLTDLCMKKQKGVVQFMKRFHPQTCPVGREVKLVIVAII
jgi:hypothetical protein